MYSFFFPFFLAKIDKVVISIGRTKYNVDKDTAKRTYDGIVFASVLEMRYYRDVVLPLSRSGDIRYFELQKEYELQPKYMHDGRIVRAINYVADFYIEYANGDIKVIDTKGYADSAAKMKRKMFWYKYPDLDYSWITYVKKWGGWLDYDAVKKLRKESKLESKIKALENKSI